MSSIRVFLAYRSGSSCEDPTREEALCELERVAELLDTRTGDPGPLKSVSERVRAVINSLDECIVQASEDADDDAIAEHIDEFTSKELEPINDRVSGMPGDPGHLYDTKERVFAVITELEKRLAKATMTLETIGRAEVVSCTR